MADGNGYMDAFRLLMPFSARFTNPHSSYITSVLSLRSLNLGDLCLVATEENIRMEYHRIH